MKDVFEVFEVPAQDARFLVDIIYESACPVPGVGHSFLAFLGLPENISFVFNDSNPICEDGVFVDAISWGITAFRAFFDARTDQFLCR